MSTIFKIAVGTAFPDRSSAKISRAVGVNQRTVQKWLADEAVPPPGVVQELSVLSSMMQEHEVMPKLREIADAWKEDEGNPEALASALAKVYFEVTGREIE